MGGRAKWTFYMGTHSICRLDIFVEKFRRPLPISNLVMITDSICRQDIFVEKLK